LEVAANAYSVKFAFVSDVCFFGGRFVCRYAKASAGTDNIGPRR